MALANETLGLASQPSRMGIGAPQDLPIYRRDPSTSTSLSEASRTSPNSESSAPPRFKNFPLGPRTGPRFLLPPEEPGASPEGAATEVTTSFRRSRISWRKSETSSRRPRSSSCCA
ncbi:hypothetical protein NX059_003079 [Plenodomus lindquistii]|nr:hypothetical protein NX059_003079 [Plenodomus lindquistii]